MQHYLSKQNTVCKNFSLQAKNIKPLTGKNSGINNCGYAAVLMSMALYLRMILILQVKSLIHKV